MDEVVSQLFSSQSALLMIGVVIGTFFIRRIVETAFPIVRKSADEMEPGQTYTNHWAAWWNEVFLHLIPVLLGTGLVFGVKGLVPITKVETPWGIALYGGIVGWFSATGYKILRRTVKTKTGIDLPSDSVSPPAKAKVAMVAATVAEKKAEDDAHRADVMKAAGDPAPVPPPVPVPASVPLVQVAAATPDLPPKPPEAPKLPEVPKP